MSSCSSSNTIIICYNVNFTKKNYDKHYNGNQFTYERVAASYVLSLVGQTSKVKKIGLKGTCQMDQE